MKPTDIRHETLDLRCFLISQVSHLRSVLLILIVIAGIAEQSFGQENNFKLKKPTNNCIGIYTGVAAYNNIGQIDYTGYLYPYYRVWNGQIIDFLISFKHKKHEIIGSPFVLFGRGIALGENLSYLYHFSAKRTHLFIEANIRNICYTIDHDDYIAPYNQNSFFLGIFSNAKIMLLTVHAALGMEFKLCNFLYAQIAIGGGGYWVNPKPGSQTNGVNPELDLFNSSNKINFYSNHYGFDWYFRTGLVWRIYNF